MGKSQHIIIHYLVIDDYLNCMDAAFSASFLLSLGIVISFRFISIRLISFSSFHFQTTLFDRVFYYLVLEIIKASRKRLCQQMNGFISFVMWCKCNREWCAERQKSHYRFNLKKRTRCTDRWIIMNANRKQCNIFTFGYILRSQKMCNEHSVHIQL